MSRLSLFFPLRGFALVCTFALLLAACGEDDFENGATSACETIEGETCMGEARSAPEDLNMMLHLVERSCATTGWNTYRLYASPATDGGAMHAAAHGLIAATMHEPTDETFEFTVTDVEASMPSMGHGTAEPERIHSEDAHLFDVNYQMPGSWLIEVTFQVDGETHTRTASWDVEVR